MAEPIDPSTIDWDRELARSRTPAATPTAPPPPPPTRECPWCKSAIPAGASACRYCGKRSNPSPDSPEGQAAAAKSSAETKRVALGCLGLIVAIVVIVAIASSHPTKETWTNFDEQRLKEAKEDYIYAVTRDRPPDEIREKKSWLDFLTEKKRAAGK